MKQLETEIAKLRRCELNLQNPKLYDGALRMKVGVMAEIGRLNQKLYSKTKQQ